MSTLTYASARHDGLRRPRAARRLALSIAAALVLTLLGAGAAQAAVTEREGPYGRIYEHVRYGKLLMETLDVYASPIPGSPTVVLVHGGGWRFIQGLMAVDPEALALQQQGFTVFSVQYPIDTTTVPAFPLESNAITSATQWALANGSLYNADPEALAFVGGSAGAQLVDLVAEHLNMAAPGTVKAVVSLSAPTNFVSLMPVVEAPEYPYVEFATSVKQAVGQEPGFTAPAARSAATTSEQNAYEAQNSPALNVTANDCAPTLLFNSESEIVPRSQAEELNAAQRRAGCSSTLDLVPGTHHAFGYWTKVAPAVISFLHAHT